MFKICELYSCCKPQLFVLFSDTWRVYLNYCFHVRFQYSNFWWNDFLIAGLISESRKEIVNTCDMSMSNREIRCVEYHWIHTRNVFLFFLLFISVGERFSHLFFDSSEWPAGRERYEKHLPKLFILEGD